MPAPNQMLHLSWDKFHQDARALAEKILSLGEGAFDKVVAVTRGGLFPAGIIARELNIRWIDTLCVASYDEEFNNDRISLLKPTVVTPAEGKILFVDDLVDTGETAKYVKQSYPNAHFAVVYAKPKGLPYADSYVQEVDRWVLFPWEAEISPSDPLVNRRRLAK